MSRLRQILALAALGAAAQAVAIETFRRQRRRQAGGRRHLLVTQGGLSLRPSGEEVADAVVSVLMGGLVLDLRHVEASHPPLRLDLLCVMGGVRVIVPEGWCVRVGVEAAMGGVRDGRAGRVDADRPPDLLLSGRVVMGGLEIDDGRPDPPSVQRPALRRQGR